MLFTRLASKFFMRPMLRPRWFSVTAAATTKLDQYIETTVSPLVTRTHPKVEAKKCVIQLGHIIRMLSIGEFGGISPAYHQTLIKLCETIVNSLPELSSTDVIRATQSFHQISPRIGFGLTTMQFEKYFSKFEKSIPGSGFFVPHPLNQKTLR